MPNGITTSGDFPTEENATADLDARLLACGWFKVYREVRGEIIQHRVGVQDKGMRIDRVLIPSPSLVEAGWQFGAIGIECKRSGTKVGRMIAQAMDYSRSVFFIRPAMIQVMLTWTFLWPLEAQTCELGSLMHQHRIGVVHTITSGLRFMVGGTGILFESEGKLIVRAPQGGDKAGNRG